MSETRRYFDDLSKRAKHSASKRKDVALIRPLIGVLIGFTVYALLLLIAQLTDSRIVGYTLFWPGILAQFGGIQSEKVFYFLSGFPFGMIGLLLASQKMQIHGIVLSVIYFVTSILAGMFLFSLSALYN